ncbi:energy-coupling factor ABC transporter substrate-binding protein [Duganella sp. FT80W]|uniref:Cobalt transport protein CbiN n=1 Tax=Duganella guangzhouensis TaxID=2666084 RepID=A0A6I2KWB4_9BURK|nr:energy-coupling factor ABC transporter substrate-binding protein [Duganella guangzhouensis]MRW90405.1 energy-coupling factor ABC transporter substrate-binding protein [Duganella guangzhouensis]
MKKLTTLMLWAAIVLLTVLPLWLVHAPAEQAVFGGADTRAQEAIGVIAPSYKPWFSPVFEPASDEIASLLFALQAAIGAGVIGYWLGLSVARDRARRAAAESPSSPQANRAD